ncbi:hypothetical protein [Nocardia sp. NPDC052566]|uniref:hypothetical protein n=1 Tax=Nocardia sp. NPDC052566 TaxID=3364330 RepID=UPI0037C88FFB
MAQFSVDLNKLVGASRAWDQTADSLEGASVQAQAITYSHKEVQWGPFLEAWNAQIKAAQYIHDRLAEGQKETRAIGEVLEHIAKVYREQDDNFANVLIKLDGEL